MNCPTDYITGTVPGVVLGVLFVVSEAMALLPEKYSKYKGILQFIIKVGASYVISKKTTEKELDGKHLDQDSNKEEEMVEINEGKMEIEIR